MKSRKRIMSTIILLVLSLFLGIFLAWHIKNINVIKGANLFGDTDQAELQEQVQQLKVVRDELSEKNADLKENLEEMIQLGNNESAQIKFYQDQVEKLATYAGVNDVKGPGAIITLDSSAEGAAVDVASLLVIVNSLKANGAYAISINGQRVVALTEISATGSGENKKIIMNGSDITSPSGYEIRIIGEVEKLQDFYRIESSIWTSLQARGVKVQVEYPPEVKIPALAKESPAYRQNLLEVEENEESTEDKD